MNDETITKVLLQIVGIPERKREERNRTLFNSITTDIFHKIIVRCQITDPGISAITMKNKTKQNKTQTILL
jgi:hypothetical protein